MHPPSARSSVFLSDNIKVFASDSTSQYSLSTTPIAVSAESTISCPTKSESLPQPPADFYPIGGWLDPPSVSSTPTPTSTDHSSSNARRPLDPAAVAGIVISVMIVVVVVVFYFGGWLVRRRLTANSDETELAVYPSAPRRRSRYVNREIVQEEEGMKREVDGGILLVDRGTNLSDGPHLMLPPSYRDATAASRHQPSDFRTWI